MNIKTKLTYGIGLLFVLITLLGGLAIKNIHNVSDDTQNILADNYNSLLYSRQMLESLDAIRENPNARKNFEAGLEAQRNNLTEKIFKRPVFVTDYPKEIKAFYMKLNEDNKTVAAMDLLVPGIGEIIGGSQREDDLVKLEERITELGMKPEDYDFYLDLRKYGSTRHAGFGLGFERCVMYLTGMSNIRDVIPFPRTVNNCEL